MLDVDSAPDFLIGRGLIDPSWILDGHLRVRALTRRNRNLRVQGPGTAGFLIKQPGAWEESCRRTLGREAAFYRFCRDEPGMAAVAGFLPALVDVDAGRSILVLETIPGAVALHPRLGAAVAEPAVRELGRGLALLHRITGPETGDVRLPSGWLDRGPPWALSLHEPRPHLLATLGPATLELLRVLQASGGLREDFAALRGRWRPGCAIHGDVRLENILVRPPGDDGPPAPGGPWIVDWEMAAIGDPAWDLAGALQDLLVQWVFSMPMSEGMGIEEMVARATIPRDLVHALARALWAGYREGAGLDPVDSIERLRRAIAFSAGRLVQSVFENLDGAGRMAGPSVVLLQIAANLLAEPGPGQVRLFGIPLDPS